VDPTGTARPSTQPAILSRGGEKEGERGKKKETARPTRATCFPLPRPSPFPREERKERKYKRNERKSHRRRGNTHQAQRLPFLSRFPSYLSLTLSSTIKEKKEGGRGEKKEGGKNATLRLDDAGAT